MQCYHGFLHFFKWEEEVEAIFCGRELVVATISNGASFLKNLENGSKTGSFTESKVDSFPALVLDAAVVLINTSTEDFLCIIPEEMFKRLFPLLKEPFNKIRSSTVCSHLRWEQHFLRSTKSDLAEVIFRLSMNRAFFKIWAPNDIRLSIFGSTESEFLNFALKYWEDSPLLMGSALNNSQNSTDIFNSLIHSFDPTTTETILNSVLQGLMSCPPIASDELDICSFLNDVKGALGFPIVYGQDIRVIRTTNLASDCIQEDVNKEQHFFDDSNGSKFSDAGYATKCREAFQDGYTVAIRGMEFRSDKIAAVADALAILFGQPSVGANIYLTPANSQGLARHYDDHCVFVCQLYGQKKWTLSPSSSTLLPRLYEPLHTLPGLEGNSGGYIHYSLKPRDVLYIPRGCIHEAHTVINDNDPQDEVSAHFSLHLTLGIEVEPPFEWEGFAHVALHCWNENQKRASCHFADHSLKNKRNMFVNLLHFAIRLISNNDPTFRKACMVAAFPLSSDSLSLNHRATFSYIVKRIDANSSFLEAFDSIKTVIQEKNDNSLQWMRWLGHLPQEGDECEKVDFSNLMGDVENLVLFCDDHTAEAMDVFSCIKSRFCTETIFEDTCHNFQLLLEKYRKVRRQYMNGMLSLHSQHSVLWH